MSKERNSSESGGIDLRPSDRSRIPVCPCARDDAARVSGGSAGRAGHIVTSGRREKCGRTGLPIPELQKRDQRGLTQMTVNGTLEECNSFLTTSDSSK
jgi:hypothetical protein